MTTDVRPFRFTGDPAAHQCDGTTAGGTSPTPVPTRGAAIAEAPSGRRSRSLGTWYDRIGVSFDAASRRGTWRSMPAPTGSSRVQERAFAELGACADPIPTATTCCSPYARRQRAAARLSGPARARPGATVTVRVDRPAERTRRSAGRDGRRPLDRRRRQVARRAVRPAAATTLQGDEGRRRSARTELSVCVTDGADGACGTAVPRAARHDGAAGGDRRHPRRPALLPPRARRASSAAPSRPTRPGCGP